ncbi:AAA family ATPase [Tenacibaculum todarodis]|uniref:AAA family ATPase n=1 Tax=Tenacibaculum todarodis TaxID=1850252 RepID=UPI000B05A46F|nr:AAA family ATPase [Tenacibaculum todarodis]
MSGFKLLAIRPLKGCLPAYRKVLKEDKLYSFYQDYKFHYQGNDITKKVINITFNSNIPDNFYFVKDNDKRENDLKINISAVVGKNGSGKSSLLDLFYFFLYVLSIKHNIIDTSSGNEMIDFYGFNCEIYYETKKGIFKSKIDRNEDQFYSLISGSWREELIDFSDFFYSIALNYSMYGLNSDGNAWYRSLFHKNDGYQTPLVINPYRNEGIINVNSELHLSQSRTLLNLSLLKDDNPIIVNDKRISEIEFVMDFAKNDKIVINNYKAYPFWDIMEECEKKEEIGFLKLFNLIAKEMIGYEMNIYESEELRESLQRDKKYEPNIIKYYENLEKTVNYSEVKFQLVKYVINKFFKICLSNPLEYDLFIKIDKDQGFNIFLLSDIRNAIKKINKDRSHITLKLIQALYSVKDDYYKFIDTFNRIKTNDVDKMSNYSFNIKWKKIKTIINNSLILNGKKLNDKLEVIPSAFVKPILKVAGNNIYDYKFLSSGEQQLSNTLQTISYHLNNINSVHYSSSDFKKNYPYVNILLDEIELYFHPDFQRKFISNLLKMLETLSIEKIDSINFIFFTHSPFILSDIPSSNILRLNAGEPDSFKESEKTFGANIHELLNHSFFMRTTVGEFSKEKINQFIKKLNDTIKNRNDEKPRLLKRSIKELEALGGQAFIELIGDSLVKDKLLQMYFLATEKNDKEGLKKYYLSKLENLN